MDKAMVKEVLKKYDYKIENLLPILLEVQKNSVGRYIENEVARYISEKVNIPYAQMSEVLTFFAAINNEKKGKFHIEMCNSTVCRVNENYQIKEFLEDYLNTKIGTTTEDGLFSLDYAPCFGACDISPSFRINKKAYGRLTVEKAKKIIDQLRGDLND